jgi:hypothetical protein
MGIRQFRPMSRTSGGAEIIAATGPPDTVAEGTSGGIARSTSGVTRLACRAG